MRLVSGSSIPEAPNNKGGLRIWIGTYGDVGPTIFDIASNGVYLTGSPNIMYPVDTSEFHTYRLQNGSGGFFYT